MKFITFGLTLALLTSCSNTHKIPDQLSPEFKTRITNTGLKHFQLRLVPNATQVVEVPLQRSRRARQQPPVNADKQARKNEKLLVTQAEIEIASVGYCGNGFWLLDKNLYGNAPYIRGECHDTATTEDRKKFPDTLLRW